MAMLATLQGWDWEFDGWIMIVGVLCATSTALLGNFLVLRRMSMLGDAVSHAVLPGLVAAFLISNSRSSLSMFVGAVIVGVLTAMFTEWIRRFGRVEESAAMGVVFTSLFALGLVMIVQANHVDLDADCVLYGAIDLTPMFTVNIGAFEVPQAAVVLSVVTLINAAFVLLCYKELKISSFDPSLAHSQGVRPAWMHYGLMVLVAVTTVASFESVGNILVVAMLVVPPSAAFLLTHRLGWMIILSVVIGAVGAVLGHVGAFAIPRAFGLPSTSTAGMMSVAIGGLFVLSLLFAPRQGLVSRSIRRVVLSQQILRDDIVAYLYRAGERHGEAIAKRSDLMTELFSTTVPMSFALRRLVSQDCIRYAGEQIELTEQGEKVGKALVRSHRLWESYLVEQAELDSSKIHDKAEQWEHFTDQALRERLEDQTSSSGLDPHGAVIPPEPQSDEDRSPEAN